MNNLEDVIVASLEDNDLKDTTPDEPTETPEPVESVEVKTEEPAPTEPTETPTDSIEVESPTAKAEKEAEKPSDDFEKRYGIPQNAASGRENRIPYSRVKKIVAKAESQAETFKKELDTIKPKFTEFETKIKTYEEKLDRVSRFESIMTNEPDKFLDMLSTLPAYQQFFKAVEAAITQAQGAVTPTTPTVADDPMPEPDHDLGDGTKVYSMDGLRKLNDWNRAQARKETLSEVEKKFGPIAQKFEANEREVEVAKRLDSVRAGVQAQIADARKWDLFNENETEITKVLQQNPNFNLERAYQVVVVPKILAERSTDRNKLREELLQEIKKAPRSTSAPASAVKSSPVSSGPRSLEDVIAEAIKPLKS